MRHALYLTCPPIKSGKPKLGETRTLPNGYLEYKEAISGDWKPAVRLNDIRGTLIANAAVQGVYTHDRGAGEETHNVTAYLPADKDFGGDFDDRPPALKQIERRADQHKKKPKGVKTHLGKVLLDPYDHPIRNFPELPATLSTEMKGWEVEHYLRKNLAIKPYDLMALCMSNYTDGKGKLHEGPPRIASLTEKATKFRRKAGLPSLKTKPGSDNINNYIKSLLPQGAETLEELNGDLDPEEVKASRAMNAGRYPNRRKKAKREEEARAKEEQMNHSGDEEEHQSAESDLALIPAVMGGSSADANISVPALGGRVNRAGGLKRGLSEVSPEAYSEDGPRLSKIQKCGTAATDVINPPKRRIRKSRNPNTIFKQPQQAAKDLPPFSLEVDALQPGFQEHGASLNQPYLWSALALDAEEVASPKIAGHSKLTESKPWHATRAFDGNYTPHRPMVSTSPKSKSGRVDGFRHPENNYPQTYASYPTAQCTSHSNLPANHMMVTESNQWMYVSYTPVPDSNTTAAPRVSLDHVMASAYYNAGPDRHRYVDRNYCGNSEDRSSSGSSSYNALSFSGTPYTTPIAHQPAYLAHSTSSKTVSPSTTTFTTAGNKPNYSQDQ